jgi:hypothetical protein
MATPNAHPITPIFISGTPGSGTTALVRVMSRLKCTMATVGRYRTVPRTLPTLYTLTEAANDATRRMWDRTTDYGQHIKAKAEFKAHTDALLALDEMKHITHVVMKRSSPFQERDLCRPDLIDVLDTFPQTRFLLSYRDPRTAAYTIYSWGYALNLRNAAVLIEEGLSFLAAQWAQIPAEQRLVIRYERLVQSPAAVLRDIAAFVGLDGDAMVNAAAHGEPLDDYADDFWRDGLHEQEIDFLTDYFDARRRSQWQILADAAGDAPYES